MQLKNDLLLIIAVLLVSEDFSSATDSVVNLSPSGMEYRTNHPSQLISSMSNILTFLNCLAMCNNNLACRTLDYDSQSHQCRLFNGDLTTGSLISSNSSKSRVGNIYIDASRYFSHSQQCTVCEQNRYEICNALTRTCQCPPTTYWDGSMCRCKLFENQTCSQADACREDLNLTCVPTTNCNGLFTQCKTSITYPAITVAGNCNGTQGSGSTTLNGPLDILQRSDGTLLVADWNNNRVQAFPANSRIGSTIVSSISNPQGLFIDSVSNLYVTSGANGIVMIQPAGLTLSLTGSSSCSWFNSLKDAYGIIVDRAGNIYVSSATCSFISVWNVNHTNATLLIASSALVNQPRHMYLDEDNSVLYVADTLNHRILKIFLDNSSTPQTVAGTSGVPGNTADKLNSPAGVYVSRIDGAIYVADTSNNRIQKWSAGASSGITIAGNSNGNAGASMYALHGPYAVILDRTETFLYVADYYNNRIQRFVLP